MTIPASRKSQRFLFALPRDALPTMPVRPPSRSIPVRRTPSTSAAYPGSPLGYKFGGNAEAAADSFAMTQAFLGARLKSQ